MESNLKEQLKDIALPLVEGEEVKQVPEADDIEAKISLWLEKHPGFDMVTMTARPADMPYELYTIIRRVAKRALKRHRDTSRKRTIYQ